MTEGLQSLGFQPELTVTWQWRRMNLTLFWHDEAEVQPRRSPEAEAGVAWLLRPRGSLRKCVLWTSFRFLPRSWRQMTWTGTSWGSSGCLWTSSEDPRQPPCGGQSRFYWWRHLRLSLQIKGGQCKYDMIILLLKIVLLKTTNIIFINQVSTVSATITSWMITPFWNDLPYRHSWS